MTMTPGQALYEHQRMLARSRRHPLTEWPEWEECSDIVRATYERYAAMDKQ